MTVLSKFVFRVTFLLFILWLDFNLMSRILVFDLRLSLLLLLVVLLQNYQDIEINDWYFPIFILGFINDLIIPSSYIGLTSFFLITSLVVLTKLKEQNYFNFISIILIGDFVYYLLTGIGVMTVSGVNLTILLLSSLLINIAKLVAVNFIFQLLVLGILNFGRDNVY
tara:strand:+ start:1220 stop:1720 length:501 start_codon:yes stop_codon:yes gene_type:complete